MSEAFRFPEVVWVNRKEFRKALNSLRTRGGSHQRAYNEACRIIGSLQQGSDESNNITHNGETRIKSCVKYSISNDAHRLVTVHSNHFIYLLFVGTHDEVDRWLDRNKGLEMVCNPETRKVAVTIISTEAQPRKVPELAVECMPEANPPYLQRLANGNRIVDLVTRRSLAKAIGLVNDDTEDDEIEDLAVETRELSAELAMLILDVLCLVREGKLKEAEARIDHHDRVAIPVAEIPEVERAAVHDITNSEELVVLTGLSPFELARLFSPAHFQDWMLFPHPEQKAIAHATFSKPAILTGVSGSGKTCVLLHRARHLARQYPGERIGVITLNRSLVRLLDNLLNELCDSSERANIEVMAFYDYAKRLVDHFGPDEELQNLKSQVEGRMDKDHFRKVISQVKPETYARELDERNKETVEDAWEIFINREDAAAHLTYVRDQLFKYDDWADSRMYLREEFSLIRSAVPTGQRQELYLGLDRRGFPLGAGSNQIEREGRAIPFTTDVRKHVLELLLMFEEEMLAGGVLDELSLTLAVLPHLSDFGELPESCRYRALLVDEFQDLSTRDLGLLRRLVPIDKPDALFLCGDTVQKVLVKHFNLAAAGFGHLDTVRRKIQKNYRNSRNILMAASRLADHYGEQANKLKEEIEVLDPELAIRETAEPRVINCRDCDEVVAAWQEARAILDAGGHVPWSVCIITAYDHGDYSVDRILQAKPDYFPIKAEKLTGDYVRHEDTMTVGTMADVKGFEFSTVILVGCGAATLPSPGRAKDEAWRDALRLYVAMTRARDEVILMHSGKPSPFLEIMSDRLSWPEARSTPDVA